MPQVYLNVIPHWFYESCLPRDWVGGNIDDPAVRARAWVEAENIYEAWKLVQRWFEMMESSETQYRHPDPHWNGEDYPNKVPLTQKVADRFIEEMDADFLLEKHRFEGKEAPDFARLPPHARIAFVQEAYGILKTTKEISKEAEIRLAAGEIMPPPP